MASSIVWWCLDLLRNRLCPRSPRTLIISTGDVSDVDGFMALAQYAKTGADVQFIMNYPAYLGVDKEDESYEAQKPGLGFKYTADQVIQRESDIKRCAELLSAYGGSQNDKMKAALTDLAWKMATSVWNEASRASWTGGRLYYTVGGINKINPFSKSAIKNELLVYSDIAGNPKKKLPTEPGTTVTADGTEDKLNYDDYEAIYIDFNGSMAFLDEKCLEKLQKALNDSKIKGAFVMGGVLSYESPLTMPAIHGTLNRFSCATMNQLYDPERTAEFFNFLNGKVPVYVITNNAVSDLATFTNNEKKKKTMEGVDNFMRENKIDCKKLKDFAAAYYESIYNPPRKPFDFYTALALTESMGGTELECIDANLFYSKDNGITLVSKEETWPLSLKDYKSRIDVDENASDSDFIKAKKANFRKELEIMAESNLPSLKVKLVTFKLEETKKLSVIHKAADVPAADGTCDANLAQEAAGNPATATHRKQA